jgi:hypothetical protein
MEPIEVLARFKHNGVIHPLSFTWKGATYPVESTGRHWRDDQGFHILVMVPGEKVYELHFDPAEMTWNARVIPQGRTLA